MTVNIRHRSGIRFGDFDIHGIKERFPVQAITSTNLGHANDMHVSNFNFRTNILEIYETSVRKILENPIYRQKEINKISNIIQQNSNKLCLLVLSGIRSRKVSREANLILIQFQIDCGFKMIKTFFQYNRHYLEDAVEYRRLIPKGRSLMFVLDEKLSPTTFEKLYRESYENHQDEIIGFFGRKPNKNNNNIRLNLTFIKDRNSDKIIRLVSFTNKWFGGTASSLVFHLFGFDVYSFWTKRWNQSIPIEELQVLNEFVTQPLTNTSNFVCVVTGTSLYNSARIMSDIGKSSVPVSIYNIVKLNELFEIIQDRYTRPQLELIAGNWFF